MKKDYIIIDRNAASAFIHEASHLNWNWVPSEIMEMSFTLRTGKKTTIGELISDGQNRVSKLSNYIQLALKESE